MTELSFFGDMLKSLLEAPEDMDQVRAQLVIDTAGLEALQKAMDQGDPYAVAIWLLAEGRTREELFRRAAETGPPKH